MVSKLKILVPSAVEVFPGSFKGGGWHYPLDYGWCENVIADLAGEKGLGNKTIFDVGCLHSSFGNYIAKKYKVNVVGIDRDPAATAATYKAHFMDLNFEQLEKDNVPEPDVILWMSSIEHNNPTKMKLLYEQSMGLLKPGGLFLATFAITNLPRSYWDRETHQTNLTPEEACEIFDVSNPEIDLAWVWAEYGNDLYLRQKYMDRFGMQFKLHADPAYVVGAVMKVKE